MQPSKKIIAIACGAALCASGAYATATPAVATLTVSTAPAPLEAAAEPVVTDDFTSLSAWSVYNGTGSLSTQGARLRENVQLQTDDTGRTFARVHVRPVTQRTTISGTTLQPGEYAAGGMSHRIGHQTYGLWEMDLRMNGSQRGVRAVALTWPEGRWPAAGEIDFVENGADLPPSTGQTAIANHYANSSGGNAQEVRRVQGNFSTWVNVEVDWQPNLLIIRFDDVEVFRTTQHVPSGPMYLCIQTAVAGGGKSAMYKGSRRSAGYLDIDNLKIYE